MQCKSSGISTIKLQRLDRCRKVPAVALGAEGVGVQQVQKVFRKVRHQLEAVDHLHVGIAPGDRPDVSAEALQDRDLLRQIAAPERRDAQHRHFVPVDADQGLVVFLHVLHGLAAELVRAERHDDLVGRIPVHLHQGFLVVDVAADPLVEDVVIQDPVGYADIRLPRAKRAVSLRDRIAEPEHLRALARG